MEDLLLVDSKILPDVYKRVLHAKQLIADGTAKTHPKPQSWQVFRAAHFISIRMAFLRTTNGMKDILLRCMLFLRIMPVL